MWSNICRKKILFTSPGFSISLNITDILCHIFPIVDSPVSCQMFSSIFDLRPLDGSSTSLTVRPTTCLLG